MKAQPVAPVVFLDIDGVLVVKQPGAFMCNPQSRNGPVRGPMSSAWSPEAVSALNKLCVEVNALVVVCSSRRQQHDCRETLRNAGVRVSFHTDWRTDSDGPLRQDEIRRWLSRNRQPPFVVLDDWPDELREITPHVVRPDFRTGLSDMDCAFARQILRPSSLPSVGGLRLG